MRYVKGQQNSKSYRLISKPVAKLSLALFLVLIFNPSMLLAQNGQEYYEISVNMDIKRVGGTEIDALIKEKELYLAVSYLFDFLKIKNTLSPDLQTISGFYISPDTKYIINHTENKIEYGDKTISLKKEDLIKTEFNLYLKTDVLNSVFGLKCDFNFRNLSVSVDTDLDLPLLRELRQEEIRKNLKKIRGETIADTIIKRRYPMFKHGMTDWSVISGQEIEGQKDLRLNLTTGGMIAGGEASASISYDSRLPFTEKQQYYMWRYVNNEQSFLRQVKLGKINTGSVSTIYNPVVGLQLTNTPTTFRRSFGTYKISDRTEPGWTVELYVNNVLVDFSVADASGFFTFDVPLVYGNTIIKLKFYGPWGEEQSREQNINVPYNFIPAKKLEYTLSSGFVEDGKFSKFGRGSLDYGLSNRISIGLGLEYLSTISSGPAMPFVHSSVRITNNIMLSGEYVHGVKAGAALSYRMPSNVQLDLKYNKFKEGQEAISYNYLEERKAQLSVPLRIGNFMSYNRLSINQLILPSSKYTSGEWLFTGQIAGINTNLTSYALFIDNTDPYFYSNLALGIRLPARILLMPQTQFSYTRGEFLTARIKLEKTFLDRAFLNITYEKDLRSNMNLAELGFRYNFDFAQAGASARRSNRKTSFTQYARGSIISDPSNKYFRTENKPNVGKGGIIIKPFLDYNSNGLRDAGEEAAPGLNLRANGGRVDKSEQDTIIAILGLEPYTSCFIELDPNSFYNIAWRLPYYTMNVEVDPNVMKSIEIPVQVVGEASGFVRINRDGDINGLGRIILNFYNPENIIVARTLSEQDGYYSYFGFKAGKYYVAPDTAQLRRTGLISEPDSISFTIENIIDGDLVSELDFMLAPAPADSLQSEMSELRRPVTRRDTSYMIIHEVVEELMTITEDSWAIQLGAFTVKSNAERLKARLEELLGKEAEIVIEGGFHKVRILDLKDREEVDAKLRVLNELGFNEFWVVRLKAMQQQLVMRQVDDTLTTIIETVIDPGEEENIREIALKIGSFTSESYARAIMDRLAFTLDKKLEIIEENGVYRIQLTDIDSPEMLEKMINALGIQGISDIRFTPETRVEVVQKTDTVLSDTLVEVFIVRDTIEREKTDSLRTKDIALEAGEIKTELAKDKLKTEEPKVSLLVGNFAKRTQALKAKKRIERKLNLPVEVTEQWDYYRVIVKGFFTPEETYRFYPELAGLGYDVMQLIDERQKK
ncbi:MAG: SPOR domain-containing protein [Marinilabiliaceae bacterium]|jgi:hypothetical protein|nr:SPOR domain-containing protein [Marinilabiliaceae bacterium]